MLDLLRSALILGIDSAVAAIAVGPLIRGGWARLAVALLFGACDAAASFAAWSFGFVPPRWFAATGAGGVALYGAYLLALGGIAGRRRRLLYVLPVLLSLDNLLSPAALPDALLFGVVSAALAGFGLVVGAGMAIPIGRRREQWAGAGVLAASVVLLLS